MTSADDVGGNEAAPDEPAAVARANGRPFCGRGAMVLDRERRRTQIGGVCGHGVIHATHLRGLVRGNPRCASLTFDPPRPAASSAPWKAGSVNASSILPWIDPERHL